MKEFQTDFLWSGAATTNQLEFYAKQFLWKEKIVFNFFSKAEKQRENTHPGQIYATQTGTAIPLSEVPDDIIKGKILGDGIAIIPSNGKVVSPIDGEITIVADTLHAYGIKSSDDLEILIHIGVDTVELKGNGFKAKVKKGDYVKMGDTLCDVDLEFLSSQKLSPHTAILISNMDAVDRIQHFTGEVRLGETIVLKYQV